jgi:hypothetical protein
MNGGVPLRGVETGGNSKQMGAFFAPQKTGLSGAPLFAPAPMLKHRG